MMRNFIALLVGVTLVPATLRAADDKLAEEGGVGQPRIEIFAAATSPAARPALLPTLYGTLAGLQIYDGYSTVAGLRTGGRETNALVGGMAGNPAMFWGLKAASTGVSIYL